MVLVTRPVVRNLEDRGAKVMARAQQRLLARRLDVAGEEKPNATGLRHHHDARVVFG
jgi:hypothetical protein